MPAPSMNAFGLVGLIHPTRPEAIAAVAECRAAGIRAKMITGDHAGTAADAPILSGELVWHVELVRSCSSLPYSACSPNAIDKGYSLPLAQTMAMNTLVVLQILHLVFIRNIHGTSLAWDAVRGTKVVWTVVITITLAQFAVTYLPPLRAVLGTQPVPLPDGLLIVAAGVAFFAIIAVEKQLRLIFRRVEGKAA